MAHDSRCGTATTPTGDCDCECDGRLHGIGDESDDTDHRSHVITDEEERIDREFDKHFKQEDIERIMRADTAPWDQLVEEEPELAQVLQDAEDNPDIDFSVGDVFWEKAPVEYEYGQQHMKSVTGLELDELSQKEYDELEHAAYEYMKRKKAHRYKKKEDMLRELNETMTEKGAFPEMEYIQSSLKKSDNNTDLDDVTWMYEGRHRFGPLVVDTDYKITEDGNLQRNMKWINTDNYDFDRRAQDIVEQQTEFEDMGNIDDVDQWIKGHHNADPQVIFTMFNESDTGKRPQLY